MLCDVINQYDYFDAPTCEQPLEVCNQYTWVCTGQRGCSDQILIPKHLFFINPYSGILW